VPARRRPLNKRLLSAGPASEGVETAIKFLFRAHTGRPGLLYAEGAFHGLTCGALSLWGDPFWGKPDFGPLLSDTAAVPFGQIPMSWDKSSYPPKKICGRHCGAHQAKAGIRLPVHDHLLFYPPSALPPLWNAVRSDEVQGLAMYRTGRFSLHINFGIETRHGDSGESPQRRTHPVRARAHAR